MTQLDNLDMNQIVFPRLGLKLTVDSVAFTLFGIDVKWYGIIITVGLLLAMWYGFSRMRSFGIDPDRAIDGVIGGIIGGIVGARTYYVLCRWDTYAGDWKAIINIRHGGLAIYGGIIGALLVGVIICKIRKVRLLPILDLTALGFLIGQGIGRWGNFTNHEAFGCNTDGIFGMSSGRIQAYLTVHADELPGVVANRPVHPCFLYESFWCLLGFVLLHIISKKWRKFDGQIFLLYMVWYGIGRFFIEGLRTDSLYVGTLRISQVVAVMTATVGLVLFIVMYSRVKRMHGDYVLYVNTVESRKLLAEADAREEEYRARRAEKKSAKTADAANIAQSVMDAAELLAAETENTNEGTTSSEAVETIEESSETENQNDKE